MSTKRIIIADDALDFGRMLQASLATLDSSLIVTVVPSAEEAMLESARIRTDLLVADLRLPGMSGLDLVRKMRTRYTNLKIIVITGLKEAGLPEKAKQAGADSFFFKPLAIGDFIDIVCTHLDLKPAMTTPVEPAISKNTIQNDVTALHIIDDGVQGLLNGLYQRLGACFVTLLGGEGQSYCFAGSADDAGFEKTAVPAWLAAAAEVEKNAKVLGCTGRALIFQSKTMEAVLVPLGSLTLVLGLKPGRSTLRLALAVEEAVAVQQELHKLVGENPISVQLERQPGQRVESLPMRENTSQKQPPKPVEESAEELPDLDLLFRQQSDMANRDLNAFWEKAASVRTSQGDNQGAISYEQAVQLGLAPKS